MLLAARRTDVSWQVGRRDIRQTQGLRNRQPNKRGLSNGRLFHKDHAGRLVFRKLARDLQSQAGFSDTSWSDQRDEACGGIREPLSQYLHVGFAPEQRRRSQGQRRVTQLIDGRMVSGRSRTGDERVTGCCRQIERSRQRPHGLHVGPSSFTAFERANGVDRQTRNCRELLLRKPRRLAKGFELHGEWTATGGFHNWLILPPLRKESAVA
jgi:hypothetical protein